MSGQETRKKDERVDDPQELGPEEEEAVGQVWRESNRGLEAASSYLKDRVHISIKTASFLT